MINPSISTFTSIKHQSGVTLIEILVTVVITSIGLLGLAVMQNTSVKASFDSYLRTQASFIAYDIIDRIRANPTATAYSLTLGDDGTEVSCFEGDTCDAGELRDFDIFYWRQNAQRVLPNSDVAIAFADPIYTITIRWTDRTENDEQTDDDANSKDFEYFFEVQQ